MVGVAVSVLADRLYKEGLRFHYNLLTLSCNDVFYRSRRATIGVSLRVSGKNAR